MLESALETSPRPLLNFGKYPEIYPMHLKNSFENKISWKRIIKTLQESKSISKEKKKRKYELLAKAKLDTIQILISKSLIGSYISHNKFVSVNNLLRKYEMKEEIKNPEISVEYTI